MTQRERVLRALRRAGRDGISQVDFLLPTVIDAGAPITRLASRVDELRQAGHRIENAGRRHGCVIYRLAARVPAPVERDRAPEPDRALFALPSPSPRSPLDPWGGER